MYWFITTKGSPNNIFIADRVFAVHYYETTQKVLFNYFYAFKKSPKKDFLITSTYSILLFTLVHSFLLGSKPSLVLFTLPLLAITPTSAKEASLWLLF